MSAEAQGAGVAADQLAAAMRAGNQAAFTALVGGHQRALHVHCYRLTGSVDDADDLVQETLLRAWRARDQVIGAGAIPAWLYRIATNAAIDLLRRRPRPRWPAGEPAERSLTSTAIAALQPYPDRHLDEPTAGSGPEAATITRETIELAFIAAIHYLPPRQRAALILRDILGWPARETAATLGLSVPAANSALQRARATLKHRLPERRLDWRQPPAPTDAERAVLGRYMAAIADGDDAALAALLRADAQVSHQPGAGGNTTAAPGWYAGRATILAAWEPILHGPAAPARRLVPTAANRQPAAAMYIRLPGAETFTAFALAVLRLEAGMVAEVTSFGADRFSDFGLPPTLAAAAPLPTGEAAHSDADATEPNEAPRQ